MTVTKHPPTRIHTAERKWVGQSIRRIEDPKFLLGKGGYIDDMRVRGMLHAALVSSPHAHAHVVVKDRLRWHRSGGQPLETVGAIASFDRGAGMLTINTNTLSFTSYLFMLAGTLKVAANKLDVIPHPAGGSFGSKLWAVK